MYTNYPNYNDNSQSPNNHYQPSAILENFIQNKKTIQTLIKKGVNSLFPIQYHTYHIIYQKRDLIAKDRTGSGKTLAFSLPILQRFRNQQKINKGKTKFLIVLPTRQLAFQVQTQILSILNQKQQFLVVPVYGGTNVRQQSNAVTKGADIIVSTPGRLIDFLQKQIVKLNDLQVICLDEADEMLKQGFQQDIQKIFKFISASGKKVQKLLFSATVPNWVIQLSQKYLQPEKLFIDLIKQQNVRTSKTIIHYSIRSQTSPTNQQISKLIQYFCGNDGRSIIFTQTKRQAAGFGNDGGLRQKVESLHGDVPQSRRQQVFKNFKSGKTKCLVATNVAARGLDFPEVDLVIQLQPPKDVQTYIHRSGRTGRAGKKGVCVVFYLPSQKYRIQKIQQVAKINFSEFNPNRQIQSIPDKIQSYNNANANSNYNKHQNRNLNDNGNIQYKNNQNKRYLKQQNILKSQVQEKNQAARINTNQIQSQQYNRQRQTISRTQFRQHEFNNLNTFENQRYFCHQNFPQYFLNRFDGIDTQIQPYFRSVAKQILDFEKDPQLALTKTLFYISGGEKESPKRSLITNELDLITFKLFKTGKIQETIQNILDEIIPATQRKKLVNLRKIKDNELIFDVQQEMEIKINRLIKCLKQSEEYKDIELKKIYQVKIKQNYRYQIPQTLKLMRYCILNKQSLQVLIEGLPLQMSPQHIKLFFIQRKVQIVLLKFRDGKIFGLCANERNVLNALRLNNTRCGENILKIDLARND